MTRSRASAVAASVRGLNRGWAPLLPEARAGLQVLREGVVARALTVAQFGSYAQQVHAHFERAYGFTWEPVGVEPEGATVSRQRLRAGINEATQTPPAVDQQGQELLERIYRLRARVLNALEPTTLAWRQRVADLGTAAARVGQRLADLSDVRGLTEIGEENRARLDEAVARRVDDWTNVEVSLDTARYNSLTGGSDVSQAEALRAIAEHVDRANDRLSELTELARPANLRNALRRTRESLDALKASLEQAIVDAPPPVDYSQKNPFSDYLQRLLYGLPVTEFTTAYTPGDSSPPRRKSYEVPPEFLVVRRSAEEHREAALCWLATARRDFWDQLPASCRRNHRPPPRTGGPANQNRVMHGIAAGMILTGQVPALPGDTSLDGATLFKRIVRRVRKQLTLAGEQGRLAVDPTGVRLPPEAPIWIAGTDAWGGREVSCIRPRLIERWPTRGEFCDPQGRDGTQ